MSGRLGRVGELGLRLLPGTLWAGWGPQHTHSTCLVQKEARGILVAPDRGVGCGAGLSLCVACLLCLSCVIRDSGEEVVGAVCLNPPAVPAYGVGRNGFLEADGRCPL